MFLITNMDIVNTGNINASTQLQVANMFLVWQSEEQISEQLNIPLAQVKWILASDDVQKYLDRTSTNTELQVHLKRIKRAWELLEPLLDKIETFIKDQNIPVSARKESHVALMRDVLLNKLPSTIAKTIWMAIQMNFNVNKKEGDFFRPELDGILKRLEPGQVLLFWDIVDKIWELFLRGMIQKINIIQKMLDDTLSN